MRVHNDSRPAAATAVDASTAPVLVTPAMVGAALQPGAARSDASFDFDMAIILAALLCVLVAAVGLSSLVLRGCGARRTLAAAAVPVPPEATDTCRTKKREELPVVVYGAKAGGVSATDCAICLAEFGGGEKLRVPPRCYHGFHVPCIDVWLATHPSCPTCRNSLLEEGDDDHAGEATVAAAREGT